MLEQFSFNTKYVYYFYEVIKETLQFDSKKLFDNQQNTDQLLALQIFAMSYFKHLWMIDDNDFVKVDEARIFSMAEVKSLCKFFNHVLYTLFSKESHNSDQEKNAF